MELKQLLTGLWAAIRHPVKTAAAVSKTGWSSPLAAAPAFGRDYEDLRKVNSALLP